MLANFPNFLAEPPKGINKVVGRSVFVCLSQDINRNHLLEIPRFRDILLDLSKVVRNDCLKSSNNCEMLDQRNATILFLYPDCLNI